MKTRQSLSDSILYTCFAVSILWCVKSYQLLFHPDLSWMGIRPHDVSGLIGILTAPLVHGSLEHIFNNTLPLLLLGSVLVYGYPRSRLRVLALVWVLSGLGVWLFARDAVHIGASGITHGIFFYLFLVSVIRRDKSSIAIMMIAFFMYGGMMMTIFPREEGISFEYHFFGAFAGIFAALLWHKKDPKPKEKRYAWEGEDEEVMSEGEGHERVQTNDDLIGDQWRESEPSDSSEKPGS